MSYMSYIQYWNPEVDRTKWGSGPWDGEPDKISWTDEATGLSCLIVRNRIGSLCGYVAVEPGHPLHGSSDWDIPLDAHGGITFTDSCDEDAPIEGAICHVPAPGKPADVWWFGFDCAHAWDVSPALSQVLGRFPNGTDITYKTVGYVRSECERLAAQLKALA